MPASRAPRRPGRRPSRQPDRLTLLAHQLVTPLSTISALAQGLMRRSERLSAADVRERGEKIWRASRRIHELIDMILTHTRAHAGAILPNPSPFRLRDMIRRVCDEEKRQAPGRTFTLDIGELPAFYPGDPVLLEQAFVIVLSNATKYSQSGRPIDVTGRTGRDETTITVTDRGIGVPEQDLPFLTRPFFRGRNARQVHGTGLGLSLVRHILHLHGGTLRIESREGHGTTVIITLPSDAETRADIGGGI